MRPCAANRLPDIAKVRWLAQIMRDGAFPAGTVIELDRDGLVADGQHRLLAVVESGSSVEFQIHDNRRP